MPAYEFVTLNVFAEGRFGGNPLAVLPDAAGLTDAAMQVLAREFNLSETTFVLPADNPDHAARVRIFTPRSELPFAGHPTVGTGFVLAQRDPARPDRLTLEVEAGLVPVDIRRNPDGGAQGAEIEAPRALAIGEAVPTDLVAACIGLHASAVRTETHYPLVASVGTGFVLVELAGRDALSAAGPDIAAFRQAAARIPDLPPHFGVLLYVRDPADPVRIHTRMFSPLDGIPEDPATGSANAALAALLVSLAPGEDLTLAFDIEQGVDMGRPSRLLASARKSAEGAVIARVGGGCIPVSRGVVEV